MGKTFLHRFAIFLVLFAVWCALSGVKTALFIAFGIASALFALWISVRMRVVDTEGYPLHLWLSAPFYWCWLIKEMAKSTLTVSKIIWSPQIKVNPSLKWIRLSQTNDLGRTIYANSITLTPGTVCVDITNQDALVHALEADSLDELMNGEMDRRVTALTLRPGAKR